jgi:beta-galactosidase
VVAIPEFEVRPELSLWYQLRNPVKSELPLTMEQIGQSYGYIVYSTVLKEAVADQPLVIDPVHDYAQVYLRPPEKPHATYGNLDVLIGSMDRHYNQSTLVLTAEKGTTVSVLVENTGRLNSTRHIRTEWKGIQSATLGGQPLTDWTIYPVPMEYPIPLLLAGLDPRPECGAHFGSGEFNLTKTGDAFLDVSALGKGLIWVNGHAVGRFWNIGPQDTLFIPAPWLKQGKNDVLVFDMFPVPGAEKLVPGAPLSKHTRFQPQTLVGRMKPTLDGPTPTYAEDPERKKKAAADAEFGPKLAAPATPPKE